MHLGYRIRYETVNKVRHASMLRSRFFALWGLFFSGFLLTTHLYWPEGWAVLQEHVPSFLKTISFSPWDTLCGHLRSCEHVSEALAVFCGEILDAVFP